MSKLQETAENGSNRKKQDETAVNGKWASRISYLCIVIEISTACRG